MRRSMGPVQPGDRQAVADFERLLRGERGYNRRTNEYVDPAEADTDPDVYVAPPLPDTERPDTRIDPLRVYE